MPKTLTTALKSLIPKNQLTQSLKSLLQPLRASASLHMLSLYLLLISLLSPCGPEIKNALTSHDYTAPSNRPLMLEGYEIPMALNADEFKNGPSIFAYHQEAKQPFLPFDLQKRNKPRAGIAPGGSAP